MKFVSLLVVIRTEGSSIRFQGGCKSCGSWLIISKMVDPILVKLSGIVKGGWENDLANNLSKS